MFGRTMAPGGTENVILSLCEILKQRVSRVIVCSAGGDGAETLREKGIDHHTIPDITRKSPITFIRTLRRLERVITENGITIVHTHHRIAALYAHILSKRLYFTHIHTAHTEFHDHRLLTRLALSHARTIACGEIVKRSLTDYYHIPDSRITLIRNAVRPFPGPVIPDKTLADLRSKGNFIAGTVARLSPEKGIDRFILSHSYVKSVCPKVKYVVIGDGPERDRLEALARILQGRNPGSAEDIIFMGHRDDARNLMAQMDLLVLSSLNEGLPLTPMEAFSVGTPVIATSAGGTREILRDGLDGYIVPSPDPEEIALKIIELIKDGNKLRRMGLNCREHFDKDLGFSRFERETIDFYKSLPE